MSANARLPVLIAGGGIGGIATAIALADGGQSVIVFEKAKRFGEIGAGIQLGPNAFHCFDALGIGDQARQLAITVDALKLMDAIDGKAIAEVPLGQGFRDRFLNPYAVVHRGDLHQLMVRSCESRPGIRLVTGHSVDRYRIDADGAVQVWFENGESARGAALIGADGLWSRVRRQMLGDEPPRVSGHTTYRSVIPLEVMPEALRWNAATLWAGPRCHIVHYPLSDWRAFNLVVTYHNRANRVVAGDPVNLDEVARGFEGVDSRLQDLIAAGDDWKKWVLCDREPATHWNDGPVVLLGDAAHPTLQYLAQGACMALEDAVVLGRFVTQFEDDLPGAFERYQRQRIVRTARVVLASRAMGDHVYHPDGAHAMVRNTLFAGWDRDEFYHRLDWLYGHRA